MTDFTSVFGLHTSDFTLRTLVFLNSYFRVGSRGARRIPSFPLGTTTSDFKGTIFPTGKLVIRTSFRAQWNAA